MSTGNILALVIGGIVLIGILLTARNWISIYNKFQYWINRAERKFADIDVIMQERLDNLQALAQIVKKYDIHEWKVLKETIEARGRWTKDVGLNEKVQSAAAIENSYLRIQAVFEKYPELKANELHRSLMKRDTVVEERLRRTRLEYNRVAQQYNERVKRFPRNIVAAIHKYTKLNYLNFMNQETFNPREIFNDAS